MMNLSKGDAVTYASLVAVAVIQATEPMRKEAAMPPDMHPFLSSALWSYAPIILLCLVAIIWAWRMLISRKTSSTQEPLKENPLKNIYKRTFEKGEIVELDGNAFFDCIFNEPVFRWHGGMFLVSNVTINGYRKFETLHHGVKATIDALKYIGLLDKEFANSWKAVPPEHFGINKP